MRVISRRRRQCKLFKSKEVPNGNLYTRIGTRTAGTGHAHAYENVKGQRCVSRAANILEGMCDAHILFMGRICTHVSDMCPTHTGSNVYI